MTKTEYAEYLQTSHWRTLRDEYLQFITACERCQIPRWLAAIAYDQDLHIHHKSYANLGDERREDIEILCRRCHEVETFGSSPLRAPKSRQCTICRATHWNPWEETCGTCSAVFSTPWLYSVSDVALPYLDKTAAQYIFDAISRDGKET